MTFSAAVTEVLRSEAARTSGNAVARRLGVYQMTVWRRLRGAVSQQSDLIDAAVATYGLAPILARMSTSDRIVLYGACESCGERAKAQRGLLRECRRCRQMGPSVQAGEVAPS